MKKILSGIASAAILLLASCTEELPVANTSLFQLEGLTATAGDETVALKWQTQKNKPAAEDYLILWTAGNPSGSNGEVTVPASATEYLVENLVNDCAYSFSIQARYPEGLSMKVKATATPKSTRIAASDFKAMAGDSRAFVSWKAPETSLEYTYKLEVKTGETVFKTIDVPSSETSYLVEELTNGTEYTFFLTAVYGHGVSPTVSDSATPGQIDPIMATSKILKVFELCTFEYNPAYFVSGTIASSSWDFGDGTSSDASTASHAYTAVGEYTARVTVTYENGKTESAEIKLTVETYSWWSIGGVGYQKASHIVFSPDGQTMYTNSTTLNKLIAVNAITGEVKWEYATNGSTYGAGPAVGPDGTVYFGTEDNDGTFYAIAANGSLRWEKKLGGKAKAAPAVTSDGFVYALADGGILKAFEAATGTEKWSATQSGNAGSVVVGADGTVYMGTSAGLWAYNADGTLKWTNADALSVTERGGSLAVHGNILYAALRGKAGCAAVNIATGGKLWQVKTTKGDCYHPVVDQDGNVYFCEKNGYLYAVDKNGTAKWTDDANSNYIYSGFALGGDGKAYISQYASPFNLVAFSSTGTKEVVKAIGVQTMSPVSIGPDNRIYYSKNGTIEVHDIKTSLASGCWPCRGGNLQGSNSLK